MGRSDVCGFALGEADGGHETAKDERRNDKGDEYRIDVTRCK